MMEIAPIPIDDFECAGKRTPVFTRTTTTALMAKVFPPIGWIVEGYVSEGLSVLAGRQKLGKTWLALDWAVAVACGGIAMGSIPCGVGDVPYIDLENGHRRMQARIKSLFPDDRQLPDLSRLEWVNDAPDLNKGFVEALNTWRNSVPNPRLVIIDVLQRIKPPGKANQNSYESDYDTMEGLQSWATEHRVAVVCLHHTRKGGADDPLEALSGSNGLSACADTTLVLDRDQNGITLYVRGRDVEEKESALNFTAGYWSLIGDAAEVRRSDERSIIADFLSDNPEPITPTEMAAALGWKLNNAKQLLFKMAKAGQLVRSKGRYSATLDNPGNCDNRFVGTG